MITAIIKTSTNRYPMELTLNDTPATAFAKACVDTEDAMISLRGVSLRAEQIGMTLEQLNVKDGDHITLAAYVKQSNAVRINLVGNVLFIKSALSLEEIETVKMYQPDALSVCNAYGKPLFKVELGEDEGTLSSESAVFGKQEIDGKAAIIMKTEPGVTREDAKESVRKDFAAQLNWLCQIEERMSDALENIQARCDNLDALFEF